MKVHDGLAYIAGHGPFDGPIPLVQGVVGRDLTLDEGYQAARMTVISVLVGLGRNGEAAAAYERAAALAPTDAEQDFLKQGGRGSR